MPAGLLGIVLVAAGHLRPAKLGGLSIAVPPSLYAASRGRPADELLHHPAGRAGLRSVGDRWKIGDLPDPALAGAAATSFMFFMYLRDVYQHSNADAGRLTNSRVFFTDPFTRWAVFVYGQDMHIPHHLFPGGPSLSPAPAARAAENSVIPTIAKPSSKRTGRFTTHWAGRPSWTR